MCGIVGYIGSEKATDVIVSGLKKLEYRGYDSSGIAVVDNGKLEILKKQGRISNLEKELDKKPISGTLGIGHTRWATHGEPSDENAHPHQSMDGKIAVVHNGIIENYIELKKKLADEHGIRFSSGTDTEIIAHLISVYYKGDLFEAVVRACKYMEGAYGLGVISSDEPEKMVAVRKDSPLIVGLSENGNFIASDIPALLKHTRDIYLLENNETVVLSRNSVEIFDKDLNPVKRDVYHVDWDETAAEKDGYEHFMLKEIHEQPKGIFETLNRRIDDAGNIVLDGINMSKEDIMKIDKVYIVACGTAYHAGLVGKNTIEKLAGIPCEVDVASEFRYRDPFVNEHTLFIAISQSGETSDTLAALREAKRRGARVLSVVNVVGSSVARESDDVFYTWAGPEIAVASTKAYTTQLVCMYLIGLYMGRTVGKIDDDIYEMYIKELSEIPEKLERFLEKEDEIHRTAERIYKRKQVFFIGRGLDAGVSYEGSLKLKEISYINSFAIAAGELKHGTIALMEKGTIVIALATQDILYDKLLSNIEEVKARGAYVIGIAKESNRKIEEKADEVIFIPDCRDEVSPLLSVVPLQLLSYYVAKLRGCDIDKPKNLAKSVTVE